MQTHFPSGGDSAYGAGLILAPFRGVRYDLSRVGALANVTSPPYDVIGPETLERLLADSPYNVVRLILPARSISSGEPSARDAGLLAAARLADWMTVGALAADDAPALYVYEQRGADWVQRGLIGLVGVGTGAVLPHEGVMPGPVAGRRELMKATRSNLEPILLVYNGGGSVSEADGDGLAGAGKTEGAGAGGHGGTAGPASRLVDETADGMAPLAVAVTEDGVTHRLWALTDTGAQAAIEADLAGRSALIADGHHRYAAYSELRDEMRDGGAGDGPWDYGLAYLVDADAYPLRLGPIHRVLPRLDPAEAARTGRGGVHGYPGDRGDGPGPPDGRGRVGDGLPAGRPGRPVAADRAGPGAARLRDAAAGVAALAAA